MRDYISVAESGIVSSAVIGLKVPRSSLMAARPTVSSTMPLVLLMLRSFGMNNAPLFYGASGVCFAIFAALYTAVYFVTSRAYYRIVR